jgi:hypothetical protein
MAYSYFQNIGLYFNHKAYKIFSKVYFIRQHILMYFVLANPANPVNVNGKAIPLQAWRGMGIPGV